MLENPIQNFLLDYLGHLKNGFVMKIELSGKPIRNGNKIVKIIPFKNKYYRKGMSDILFCYKGKFFCFEVKKKDEHEKILRNYERIKNTPIKMLPNYLHHAKEQMNFIQEIKRAGGDGDFVSNLEHVKEILRRNDECRI